MKAVFGVLNLIFFYLCFILDLVTDKISLPFVLWSLNLILDFCLMLSTFVIFGPFLFFLMKKISKTLFFKTQI